MNETSPRPRRMPTQAAEGLPRWRWTLAEFDRFIELGILTEDDRVELIGGELVPMAAKGNRHERIRLKLTNLIARQLPDDCDLLAEPGWRPDDSTYAEPDIVLAAPFDPPQRVPVAEVWLVIEVADTSLAYDLTTKAQIYAGLGVTEYWVIDAARLTTHVHLSPTSAGYGLIEAVDASRLLQPQRVPGLSIRIADLGIDRE